jgi:hypothetical protein
MLRWGGGFLLVVLVIAVWLVSNSRASTPREAPEAQRILEVQGEMPFQIMIPAYLPNTFLREQVGIDINQQGPGGEPLAQLSYRTKRGVTLHIKEWVPIDPAKEILAGSRPVETRWGRAWFLRQGEGLMAIWVDIGPTRASIFTANQQELSKEELLAIAESMGPASNSQVFSFLLEPPEIRQVEPPPPLEIPVDADGVQRVDLIVTPGGYSPLRFSVQKGVPVALTFRQLGRVGCGNELNLPNGSGDTLSLRLETASDSQTVNFTPNETGDYEFFCPHLMYRGIMTVRE